MIPSRFHVIPDGLPNDGILFANHEPNHRSGHMGHALVEYAPGKVLAFYPNCSDEDKRMKGHSGFGWMEYKRSEDGGDTWSEAVIEPNSKALFDQHIGRTMMIEKAVCTDTGRILLFYLTCDMVTDGHIWEPYFEPRIAYSDDEGRTWSKDELLVHEAGLVYDVLYKDGTIYLLFLANAELPGIAHLQEHPYKLFVSHNGGASFEERSILNFQSTIYCYYGTMAFREDGSLIAYVYDERDEFNLKYVVSYDDGFTWTDNRRCFFAKKIRNPQIKQFDGTWICHGRTGCFGRDSSHFVIYFSEDGMNWDEGTIMRYATQGAGAYSNNVTIHRPGKPERFMIQTSHAYWENRTNTIMWLIDLEK